MRKEITLFDYLRLGGNLEKLNWSDAYCDYGDRNKDAIVVSCEDKGEKNTFGEPLFYFTFDNGRTHRYALSWIKILGVEFVLSEKYI